MTTTLRFNPNGIGLAELMLGSCSVTDLLPGYLPEGDEVGDEWNEELVLRFPHLGEGSE